MIHFIGQNVTIAYVLWCVLTFNWILLLFAPLVVYPFAWAGHFFFEKNRPAAFKHPILAKACDWLMYRDIWLGKLTERFDPIRDEKKEFTLEEWVNLVQNELRAYHEEWEDSNEFHKKKHTWAEWHNAFVRYMSW